MKFNNSLPIIVLYCYIQQDDIASFRDDAIRTVQAVHACEKGGEPLDEDQYCARGLEQKLLKRPPPNFVKRVLRLQAKLRRSGFGDSATSLQLFSEACSKWARKRAVQLAAEDEFDAYQIFMAGLRGQQQYDHEGDEFDEDDEYCEDDFDFCTESDFVNDIYDYKHDVTEDETEFDDSDAYDNIVAVNKDGQVMDSFYEEDPFAEEDGDLLTPAY